MCFVIISNIRWWNIQRIDIYERIHNNTLAHDMSHVNGVLTWQEVASHAVRLKSFIYVLEHTITDQACYFF